MEGASLGGVRNGVDANGAPVIVPIDIRPIATESPEASYGVGQGDYNVSTNVLELSFDAGSKTESHTGQQVLPDSPRLPDFQLSKLRYYTCG